MSEILDNLKQMANSPAYAARQVVLLGAVLKIDDLESKLEATNAKLEEANRLMNEAKRGLDHYESMEHPDSVCDRLTAELESTKAELEETQKRLKTVEHAKFEAYDRGYNAGVDDDKERLTRDKNMRLELHHKGNNNAGPMFDVKDESGVSHGSMIAERGNRWTVKSLDLRFLASGLNRASLLVDLAAYIEGPSV